MPTRTSDKRRTPRTRRPSRTAAPVRTAAALAVERVLGSDEAFALMIDRLQAAGWRIERAPAHVVPPSARAATLTVPERAR
jgi:hypothetical protein